jgi:hypothetical protein
MVVSSLLRDFLTEREPRSVPVTIGVPGKNCDVHLSREKAVAKLGFDLLCDFQVDSFEISML